MSMMVYTVQKNMNNETMSSDDNSDSGGSSSFSEEEEVFEDVIANPQNEDDEEYNRVFRKWKWHPNSYNFIVGTINTSLQKYILLVLVKNLSSCSLRKRCLSQQ